ncbi:MAG: pyruvate kinase, partial [Simkaniaceae bacterium]|nr:pyruvate kinase [Simkaniaceae bacterium]
MVARGDLGVELPLTQVPKLQKMMIRKGYQLFKPVVTATQMLESMVNQPRPTRAEVSDVANAIYDSTSLVMLSGETAVGKYPVDTVKMMKSIIIEAEKDFNYSDFFYHDLSKKEFNDVSSSVALATVKTAYSARGKAIIAFTSRGSTARAIGRFRPEMPVIALTSNEKTYHQLAFNWGIVPVLEKADNLKSGFDAASNFALNNHYVQYGDLVVISYGSPFGVSGTTNTMMVDNIGEVLVRGEKGFGGRVHGAVSIIVSEKHEKQYLSKGRIAIISTCNNNYESIFHLAAGVILQNHPEDCISENSAKELAEKCNTPLITRADSAMSILNEGGLVTLYPSKGLVFKGVVQS